MGKSLNGKELGKGISQRRDGLYQACFVNRFGKRGTYAGRYRRGQKLEIELKGRMAPEEYENLVFVTKNNRPTQQFIVQEGIEACVRNIQKILGHGSLQMTMDLYF